MGLRGEGLGVLVVILDALHERPRRSVIRLLRLCCSQGCDYNADHRPVPASAQGLVGAEQRNSISTIHIGDWVLGTLGEVLVHRSIQILRTYCFFCFPTNKLPAPWNSYVILHPSSVQR